MLGVELGVVRIEAAFKISDASVITATSAVWSVAWSSVVGGTSVRIIFLVLLSMVCVVDGRSSWRG